MQKLVLDLGHSILDLGHSTRPTTSLAKTHALNKGDRKKSPDFVHQLTIFKMLYRDVSLVEACLDEVRTFFAKPHKVLFFELSKGTYVRCRHVMFDMAPIGCVDK
jgi:hypothetical protein